MHLVKFILVVHVFVAWWSLYALECQDNLAIDVVAYDGIKKECDRVVYFYYRNLHILEWPDSVIKELLKIQLEPYLIEDLNTTESHKLYQKYEEVDWNVHEMMKINMSNDQ
ncbi:MAG: hypothetical protein KGI80_00435 [Verrucomicrobiota bacterium]|nr:hypothetical protein [Verrucomicrobiota bacterium]